MLYRLTALHQRLGGGVLKAFNRPGTKVRKWWVNPDRLARLVEDEGVDVDDVEEQLGEHLLRIEALEEKFKALRDGHIALKRKVNSPPQGQ
jgi:hypothetical protein